MTCEETKRVLVVEDEMEMRFYLMAMIKSLGWEPVMTRNGVQGLSALKDRIPEMIILDVMMPEKGGAKLYQELLTDRRYKAIPLLIFSGVDPTAFEHYVRMLNATLTEKIPVPKYYVEKSADPDYLKGMILKCMKEGGV